MAKLLRSLWKTALIKHTSTNKASHTVRTVSILTSADKCRTNSILQASTSTNSRLLKHAALSLGTCVPKRHYPRKSSWDDVQTEYDYDPYEEFKTPSPFKVANVDRHYGYSPNYFTDGLLPRPKGEYEDKPLTFAKRDYPKRRDQWKPEKALFGQNDYIDILGDGSLHPWQLYKAPIWLKGWRGNELQRLIRKKRYVGKQMQHMYPTQYMMMNKRIFYLWKKHNIKRSTQPFWGNRRRANRGRLERPLLFP